MTTLIIAVSIPLALLFLWRFNFGFRELQRIAGSWMHRNLRDVFRVKWFLVIISLFIFIVALSFAIFDLFPQTVFVPDETVGTEIVFLLDVSRSMNAADISPTRLQKSVDVIHSITERSRGIPKGLVIFKGKGLTVVPITEDNEAIYTYLNNISSSFFSSKGTNIEEGLKTAMSAFSNSKSKNKYLFIFTDGEALEGNESRLTARIQSLSVKIAVIGAGTPEGATIPAENGVVLNPAGEPVTTRLDEIRLKQLTQSVKGSYIHIESSTALSELSREATEEKENFKIVKTSRYRLYLLIALFAILVYAATRIIRWKNCF
ncbi:MAG: VWA domain-containing protein [Spirochaetales bacterium]|nr:VWA domain-containing protein [Spirochaetales bacterium]